MTKKARDRAYHMSCYVISEENRLGLLTKEQLKQRFKEAWENAYGDMEKPKKD